MRHTAARELSGRAFSHPSVRLTAECPLGTISAVSNSRSVLTAVIVAITLLSASVVHACSSFVSLQGLFKANTPMSMADGPCTKHKEDICQSVRDRLRSLKAPSADTSFLNHLAAVVDLFTRFSSGHDSAPAGKKLFTVWFHPVFKLPLSLSYAVLRI
jgi:hypothetical protein